MEILNLNDENAQGKILKNTSCKNNTNGSELPHPVHLLSTTQTELLPKILALNNVQKKIQGLEENCGFIENLSQNLKSSFENNEQILCGISVDVNISSQSYENAFDDRKIKESKFLKDLESIVIDPNKYDNTISSEILHPDHSEVHKKFISTGTETVASNRFGHNLFLREILHDADRTCAEVAEEISPNQVSAHKKTNQVTFIKSSKPKNPISSNTNAASRPSDADSMLTNRKWDSLKQTIRETKNSISQDINVEVPLSPKSRLHARQIQKSQHFKLRLQEACHLMDDLMSTQPDCINSIPTVSATSSTSPPPLKSQQKWNDGSWKPAPQCSSNKDQALNVKKQHSSWIESDSILQNGSYSDFDKFKSSNTIPDQIRSKPPRRKLVTLKNGLTGKRRKLGIKSNSVNVDSDKPSRTVSMGQDIQVASTIAEISEETYSSNKPRTTDKPSVTLPLYKKAPRRLVVRMTRAAALRKKLTLSKINSNVSKKPSKTKMKQVNKENVLSPQLVQTPRAYDENALLRRAVNITSYTDRLKGLQNKTDSGSPLNSFISDVSSPSTWEVGDDIKAILYGNDSVTEFLENNLHESDRIESE